MWGAASARTRSTDGRPFNRSKYAVTCDHRFAEPKLKRRER